MTVRFTLVLATVAASLAASASSVSAQETPAFDAWGHTFDVPNSQGQAVEAAAPRRNAILATGSVAPRGVYASGTADLATSEDVVAPAPATRTINVWGARLDLPNR